MNSEKVQTIINQLINEHGRPVRKQYPVAKHQIQTLTELGILELMPVKFGHGDAKIVIEEAQRGATSVMSVDGEGVEIGSSKLYDAINEVVVVETEPQAQTFTVSESDNEVVIDGETFIVTINRDDSVSIEIDGGYGLADYDDGSQGYVEIDGRYEVARFDDIEIGDDYDSEFQVTITPEMIADAKQYRANYPMDIEEVELINDVMTPAEIETEFNLSSGTVRQYLTRHGDEMTERGEARKADGRTWLILRSAAARIWDTRQ